MIDRLAELIRDHQPCLVLTGAGVSTESGIPDFRSPTGMWAEFDPLEYATLGAFRRDPEKVWRFYAPRFSMLADAEPNRAHHAIAELERRGYVRALVTQNIDLLHERAGSREVVEVHGSIRTSTCLACDARYALAAVLPLVKAHGAPPCVSCGTILKPDVVFFDELLPDGALERAQELAAEARLLLVVGSSLEVYPVADLPRTTLDAGGEVAVVNRTPTWVDGRAVLRLDGSAGEVLEAAAHALRVPAEVVDYDPGWPAAYEKEARRVREALGEAVVEMEHMGSTAVPGLAGKPVIDISVGLSRLELDERQIESMRRLGYQYLGEHGLPGRLFFRKDEGGRRTHHVHAVEADGDHWHRHHAFREYLRVHPEEAARYAEEKRRIAAEVAHHDEYWERKEPYADALFARAWRWYGRG